MVAQLAQGSSFRRLMSASDGDNQIRKVAFIDATHDALLWLDDWPEGLKLNTELSSFLVHTLLGVLELWACGYPHSMPLAIFGIKVNTSIRHFTFTIATFSHYRICDWPFWIWRTNNSIVTIFGHLQRTDPAYLLEPPGVEKGPLIPNISAALVV